MQGYGVTFPTVFDTGGTVVTAYSVGSIPRCLVIGRDNVISKDGGAAEYSVLENLLLDVVYMRNAVDVAMVMDISATMMDPSPSAPGGDKKLDMMKQSITMVTDFLRDHGQFNDRMGLVWFTDDCHVYRNPANEELLSVYSANSELRAQIQSQTTGTCTAMGAGIQAAFDMLSASQQGKFTILCTDGMQNVQPMVQRVGSHYQIVDSPGMYECGGHSTIPSHPGIDIASYGTRVHTIGVGITANYASLLQEIANATGGFYKGTDDPQNDLDLLYFTDLCNCMAGASPAVVLHATGTLPHNVCVVTEHFQLNASVRKMAVLLSWTQADKGALSFWLRAPDGTLLDLHEEIRLFDTHALATVCLPKMQSGATLPYVGTWSMHIRGETEQDLTQYHAMVVAEDVAVHFHADFPRKVYDVGDILPVRCTFRGVERPLRIRELSVETARLRLPLPEVLASYTVSSHELRRRGCGSAGKSLGDPLQAKIAILSKSPRFREMVRPIRTTASLAGGDLKCELEGTEVLIPVKLSQPGLISLKVKAHAEGAQGGPLQRTDVVSVFVAPGRPSRERSTLNIVRVGDKKESGYLLHFTPRNAFGQLFGPGHEASFRVLLAGKACPAEIEDALDGSYRVGVAAPSAKKGEALTVLFQGLTIWSQE